MLKNCPERRNLCNLLCLTFYTVLLITSTVSDYIRCCTELRVMQIEAKILQSPRLAHLCVYKSSTVLRDKCSWSDSLLSEQADVEGQLSIPAEMFYFSDYSGMFPTNLEKKMNWMMSLLWNKSLLRSSRSYCHNMYFLRHFWRPSVSYILKSFSLLEPQFFHLAHRANKDDKS